MATSREAARDALKILLEAALVGAGLPVKTVTASKVKSLKGLTPLVTVLSGGTLREPGPINHPLFHLEIQVFVLQQGTGWSLAEAEDALDTIESLIAGVYEDNRGTVVWSLLEYEGPTTVIEATSDGDLYYLETIPTLVMTTKG